MILVSNLGFFLARSSVSQFLEMFQCKNKLKLYIFFSNSHTVSGHEAAHLAKRLTAELAQQQGRSLTTYDNSRTVSPDSEPRARSFDQQRGDVNQNNGMISFDLFFTLIFFQLS